MEPFTFPTTWLSLSAMLQSQLFTSQSFQRATISLSLSLPSLPSRQPAKLPSQPSQPPEFDELIRITFGACGKWGCNLSWQWCGGSQVRWAARRELQLCFSRATKQCSIGLNDATIRPCWASFLPSSLPCLLLPPWNVRVYLVNRLFYCLLHLLGFVCLCVCFHCFHCPAPLIIFRGFTSYHSELITCSLLSFPLFPLILIPGVAFLLCCCLLHNPLFSFILILIINFSIMFPLLSLLKCSDIKW